MMGSHFDSVGHGGAYDGIAGVVCAIEVARLLKKSGKKPYYSLEVIATNDEEGARFHVGLFTGKVLLGQLTVEDLHKQADADGISVYEAMAAYGLKPEEIAEHQRKDIKAFLEVHIEQGPVLEAADKQIGIVDVIVGIKRVSVRINGRADHVGTMPMHMRKDALEQAAMVISKICDRARCFPNTVATVGFLQVEPNIINIVPQTVTFTVDIRGVDKASITSQYQGLVADLEQMQAASGLTYDVETLRISRSFLRQAVLLEASRICIFLAALGTMRRFSASSCLRQCCLCRASADAAIVLRKRAGQRIWLRLCWWRAMRCRPCWRGNKKDTTNILLYPERFIIILVETPDRLVTP